MSDKRNAIIEELKISYRMEIETVMNYLANSINLDGVRAEEIKKSLEADIAAELNHARLLGRRIKTLGGAVPGSLAMKFDQASMQPPDDPTHVVAVIKGVIEAEDCACRQYEKLIKLCDGEDYVTQDLCITLLGDEEEHRREFRGFLKEYAK
ncbi:MAG: rubrerythrin [Phycisphaerales bacterium]|nr:MAG: rubrerythrin [Phycisphaerales bacterium]